MRLSLVMIALIMLTLSVISTPGQAAGAQDWGYCDMRGNVAGVKACGKGGIGFKRSAMMINGSLVSTTIQADKIDDPLGSYMCDSVFESPASCLDQCVRSKPNSTSLTCGGSTRFCESRFLGINRRLDDLAPMVLNGVSIVVSTQDLGLSVGSVTGAFYCNGLVSGLCVATPDQTKASVAQLIGGLRDMVNNRSAAVAKDGVMIRGTVVYSDYKSVQSAVNRITCLRQMVTCVITVDMSAQVDRLHAIVDIDPSSAMLLNLINVRYASPTDSAGFLLDAASTGANVYRMFVFSETIQLVNPTAAQYTFVTAATRLRVESSPSSIIKRLLAPFAVLAGSITNANAATPYFTDIALSPLDDPGTNLLGTAKDGCMPTSIATCVCRHVKKNPLAMTVGSKRGLELPKRSEFFYKPVPYQQISENFPSTRSVVFPQESCVRRFGGIYCHDDCKFTDETCVFKRVNESSHSVNRKLLSVDNMSLKGRSLLEAVVASDGQFKVTVGEKQLVVSRDLTKDACYPNCERQPEYILSLVINGERMDIPINSAYAVEELSGDIMGQSGMMTLVIKTAGGGVPVYVDSIRRIGVRSCEVADCWLCAESFENFTCSSKIDKALFILFYGSMIVAVCTALYWIVVYGLLAFFICANMCNSLLCCSCCFRLRTAMVGAAGGLGSQIAMSYKKAIEDTTANADNAELSIKVEKSPETKSLVKQGRRTKGVFPTKTTLCILIFCMCAPVLLADGLVVFDSKFNKFSSHLHADESSQHLIADTPSSFISSPAGTLPAVSELQLYKNQALSVYTKHCDNGVNIPASYQSCTKKDSRMSCSITMETSSILPAGGSTLCYDVGNHGTPLMRVVVVVHQTSFRKPYRSLYKTSDYEFVSMSRKYCANESPCDSMGSAIDGSSDPGGIFSDLDPRVMTSPGVTSYHDSCGCAGCGCFICSAACTYTRWAYILDASKPYIVHEPLNDLVVRSTMSIIMMDGPGMEHISLLYKGPLEVGKTVEAGDFDVTLSGGLLDYEPAKSYPDYAVTSSVCTPFCGPFEIYTVPKSLVSEQNKPMPGLIGDAQIPISSKSATGADAMIDKTAVSCTKATHDTCSKGGENGIKLLKHASVGLIPHDGLSAMTEGNNAVSLLRTELGVPKPSLITVKSRTAHLVDIPETLVCPKIEGEVVWTGEFNKIGGCVVSFTAYSDKGCQSGLASVDFGNPDVRMATSTVALTSLDDQADDAHDQHKFSIQGYCPTDKVLAGTLTITKLTHSSQASYLSADLIFNDESLNNTNAYSRATVIVGPDSSNGAWDAAESASSYVSGVLGWFAALLGGNKLWEAILSILICAAAVIISTSLTVAGIKMAWRRKKGKFTEPIEYHNYVRLGDVRQRTRLTQ